MIGLYLFILTLVFSLEANGVEKRIEEKQAIALKDLVERLKNQEKIIYEKTKENIKLKEKVDLLTIQIEWIKKQSAEYSKIKEKNRPKSDRFLLSSTIGFIFLDQRPSPVIAITLGVRF